MNANNDNSIAGFLERKLTWINKTESISNRGNDSMDFMNRVSEAVVRANNYMKRVSVEIGGKDVSKEIFNKVKLEIPNGFKKEPVVHECLGFCLEIYN